MLSQRLVDQSRLSARPCLTTYGHQVIKCHTTSSRFNQITAYHVLLCFMIDLDGVDITMCPASDRSKLSLCCKNIKLGPGFMGSYDEYLQFLHYNDGNTVVKRVDLKRQGCGIKVLPKTISKSRELRL